MILFDEFDAASPYLNRPRRTLAQALGESLTWECPRCGVKVDDPDCCEGCRDPQCPAAQGAAA